MSKRYELKERVRTLAEIKDILTAMKNLSLVEIAKISRYLASQRQKVACIEDAISDFVSFHPLPAAAPGRRTVCLLIGSERGFCGGFNEMVIRQSNQVLERESRPPETTLIVRRREAGDKTAGRSSRRADAGGTLST